MDRDLEGPVSFLGEGPASCPPIPVTVPRAPGLMFLGGLFLCREVI